MPLGFITKHALFCRVVIWSSLTSSHSIGVGICSSFSSMQTFHRQSFLGEPSAKPLNGQQLCSGSTSPGTTQPLDSTQTGFLLGRASASGHFNGQQPSSGSASPGIMQPLDSTKTGF
ncbi:hypothetical protein XELAEV_18001393mg [Xenopus laevis]|nr:hypothetical protein XELAEV_18001393mg [Xenopus laevis]